MPRPSALDVLIALTAAPEDGMASGAQITARLVGAGMRVGPGRLMHQLLELEQAGHVEVVRPDYRFALTDRGQAAVVELGPGEPVDVTVVMVDLVGFVAFTDAHGDRAAVRAAQRIHRATGAVLGRHGGRVVKHLGDGVLGCLPPDADPIPALTEIAADVRSDDGPRLPIRAAARAGSPIGLHGDLYGTDVNVTSRLCDLARPGEAILGFASRDLEEAPDGLERVEVRGIAAAVPIVRVRL